MTVQPYRDNPGRLLSSARDLSILRIGMLLITAIINFNPGEKRALARRIATANLDFLALNAIFIKNPQRIVVFIKNRIERPSRAASIRAFESV